MISPTTEVPKKMINAPTPVTRAAMPSHEALPTLPARVNAVTETKKRSEPIITLGCDRGILNLETKRPKVKKINGKNIVAQEKRRTKKSLSRTNMSPCRENETITSPAREKNVIWTMEYIVAGLSFSLNDFLDFDLLFLFLAINPLYPTD